MTVRPSPLAFAVNKQPDIHDVEFRQESEANAFREVRDVLRRHGLDKKYGITLLHKHFDLADDEIMVEHTDLENRTLTSKPAKIGDVPTSNLVEVTWSLEEDKTMGVCIWRCYYDANSNPQHVGKHMAQGV